MAKQVDMGAVLKEHSTALQGEVTRVKALKEKEKNSEEKAQRAAMRAALKQADALGLSESAVQEMTAALGKVANASDIDSTAGDLHASILSALVKVPGALTQKESDAVNALVSTWVDTRSTRKARGEGSGEPTTQPFTLGPIAFYAPGLDAPYAVEDSTWSSVFHTLRKGVRVREGFDAEDGAVKVSFPNASEARTILGERAGRDGEPSIEPASALGTRVEIPTRVGTFSIERVASKSRGAGLGAIPLTAEGQARVDALANAEKKESA